MPPPTTTSRISFSAHLAVVHVAPGFGVGHDLAVPPGEQPRRFVAELSVGVDCGAEVAAWSVGVVRVEARHTAIVVGTTYTSPIALSYHRRVELERLVYAALPWYGRFMVILSWMMLARAILKLHPSDGHIAGLIFVLGLFLANAKKIDPPEKLGFSSDQ